MSDVKELTNGLDDTTKLSGAAKDVLSDVCDHCGSVARPNLETTLPPSLIVAPNLEVSLPQGMLVIPAGVVSVSAAILSVGIVVALLYFMQLCFAHPNEATTIIPLLLTVLTWVATRMYERNRRCADGTRSDTTSIEPNKPH